MSSEESSDGTAFDKGGTAESQKHPQERDGLVREALRHFDWSWFTCTQSTGGIAVVLSETPHQFDGLRTIGIIIFIFNTVLYLCFLATMATKWVLLPASARNCFVKPPECYFYGSVWLSSATVILCAQRYGVPHAGPWLLVAVRVCFWIYAAVTFTSSTTHLVAIFRYTPVKLVEMNTAWFILIFNMMLTGTVAAAIAAEQPPEQRLPIIVAGVAYQGLGWLACSIFLVWFIGKQMETGWPPPALRPGLFMPVGSTGYTIVALIGAARALPADYAYFAVHPLAIEVLQIVALWAGIFMWMFTLWLFGLALGVNVASVFVRRDGRWRLNMTFTMAWWAFIFPNVGFTLATIYIGQELESPGILWVSTAMTILLVIFWLLDLVLMAKHFAVLPIVHLMRKRRKAT